MKNTKIRVISLALAVLLILAAGIGAVVENAQEGLKEIADLILPCCEENAIAHLIEFLEEMYE